MVKINSLTFKLLVKKGIAKEILPLVWRFGDNVKVQAIVNGSVNAGNRNSDDMLHLGSVNHCDGNVNNGDCGKLPQKHRSCKVVMSISNFYSIFILLNELSKS